MSVQQVVWTATAADPTIKRVQLLVDGQTPPSGHSDWSTPVARANAFDTLALVWILRPAEGATVTSPVKIRVFGTGYEGNVPIKIFSDGTLVASTYVTTMMGSLRRGPDDHHAARGDVRHQGLQRQRQGREPAALGHQDLHGGLRPHRSTPRGEVPRAVQRGVRDRRTAAAAVPAVDVRRTDGPRRTADAPPPAKAASSSGADAALRTDDEHHVARRGRR